MLNAVKHLYGNNNFAILLSLREIRMTALFLLSCQRKLVSRGTEHFKL